MELKNKLKDLTEQQKKELKEAKTKEELNALVSSAGFELDDDELDAVAGGIDYDNCPNVKCPHCATFHNLCDYGGLYWPEGGYPTHDDPCPDFTRSDSSIIL